MKLNMPEWPYLLIGTFFSAIVGAFPVAFALILSEILKVCLSSIFSHDYDKRYFDKLNLNQTIFRSTRNNNMITIPAIFNNCFNRENTLMKFFIRKKKAPRD